LVENAVQFDDLLKQPPYSQAAAVKRQCLASLLGQITDFHSRHCEPYRRMLAAQGFAAGRAAGCEDLPFLPVRLFKEYELLSVARQDVVKLMTSSGTTGQAVSKIFLDKQTALNQKKVLAKIVSALVGASRLPLIVLDTAGVLQDPARFSARAAGILGFTMFGTDVLYALDNEMRVATEKLAAFLEKHRGERLLLFGFTFIVWQHFYQELLKSGYRPDLSAGVLIHGGGWKKLLAAAVAPAEYKQRLRDLCGLARVHDYYGMVEQAGSIHVECEQGRLHASIFSDIITRRPADFSPCRFGEKGIVEVLSVLPLSYPGHVLLTEDEGVILGEDDCPCGRLGKYFQVTGRLPRAELRGCSDTYAARFD
jgi:phenylacetate-coenzyme A ligase PaaK-like adenylate-forming protein